MRHVAFVTYHSDPQLSDSDQRLVNPLRAYGVHVTAVPWDEKTVDWNSFEAVVLRSCWNYHMQPHAFRQWIEHLEQNAIPLYNSAKTVLWNMDKTYLRQMAEQGVKTIPTVWATQKDHKVLNQILKEEAWSEAVLKPTISASADGIQIITRATATQQQSLFESLMSSGTIMLQPLVKEIYEGELSFIFFHNEFSHAIRKMPGEGTIFVTGPSKGSHFAVNAPQTLIQTASTILETALRLIGETTCLYARVDGVLIKDEFVLMELELIEPSLFLESASPQAAQNFAAALDKMCRGG